MAAPLIGITSYGRDAENRFTLYAQYVDGIRRAGGLPVLLPPGEPRWREWLEHVDGLLLSGGSDVGPELYGSGGHGTIRGVDEERDATELELARAVFAGRWPALFVCRGMQMLDVALGGTLIEHLPDEVDGRVAHRAPPDEPVPHAVEVDPDSRLAHVLGATSVTPPSWHHQAIRALAPGLRVVARAPDGVIEAVEPSAPGAHAWLLAVQWHPELSAERDPTQQRLLDALVAAAREARAAADLSRSLP